jgi:hypothetical protein
VTIKRRSSFTKSKSDLRKTWDLDGLPPTVLEVGAARRVAGSILADAKRGRSEGIVAALTEGGYDSDQSAMLLGAMDLANGNTALMLAAKNGHHACCEVLLQRGADPAARNRASQTAHDLAQAAGHDKVLVVLGTKGIM